MKIGKMVMVGCGGIGRHFIMPGISMLPKDCSVVVIDGDTFEDSNISRQMISAEVLGRPKAGVTARMIGHQLGRAVDAIEQYIHDDEQFAAIVVKNNVRLRDLHGPDVVTIVAICVDNDATRKLIYDGVRMTKANVVVIDMANEEYKGDVIVWGWIESASIGPFPPDMYPQIKEPNDRPPGASCMVEVAKGNTQLIVTNMMAATIGLYYMQSLLKGHTLVPQIMFDWQKEQIAWRM